MTVKAEFIDSGRFTPREADVAQLMAEGYGDKAIARFLALSIKTVQIHTMHIYEKLELHSAALEANRAGLNMRVRALSVMVARGMVSLSINSIFAFVVLNALALDDQATRAKGKGRVGTSMVRVRRAGDA